MRRAGSEQMTTHSPGYLSQPLKPSSAWLMPSWVGLHEMSTGNSNEIWRAKRHIVFYGALDDNVQNRRRVGHLRKCSKCKRVKSCIAVRANVSPRRELTCHLGSHSVTCHPAEVTFPPLPQPKLVLDLPTPEGCKAELTWLAG